MSKKSDPKQNEKKIENLKTKADSAPGAQKSSSPKVPFMLDVVYNFSIIFIVVVGTMVAALSLLAGVDALNTALRAGITVLLLGFGFIGLYWYVSKSSLESAMNEMKEYLQDNSQKEAATSTKEIKA